MLLGDQVYADVTSPTVRRLLKRRRRRPKGAPANQVVSFDEYTKLYLESWRDPEIRWLLSTVPSVMIFDDHEIIDDWNTSASWRADMREPAVVGGADPQRPRLVLGLPAPGQPVPGRDRRRPGLRQGDRRRGRHGRAARVRRAGRPGGRRGARHRALAGGAVPVELRAGPGPDPARHAGQPVQPGARAGNRAMLPPGEWSWFLDRAHGGLRPPGGRRLAALAAAAGHPPRRGVERAARRLPPAVGGARSRSSSAGPWTWSTGRRSGVPSRRSASCSPGSAAARRGGGRRGSAPARRTPRRPRSACSPGTCTTRTWPGPGSPTRRAHPGAPAHLLAPSTTRCRPAIRPLMRLGWSPGPAGGHPGPGPLGRGAPTDGALAEAGRAVLRQRGGHADPPGPGGRGDDRGHHRATGTYAPWRGGGSPPRLLSTLSRRGRAPAGAAARGGARVDRAAAPGPGAVLGDRPGGASQPGAERLRAAALAAPVRLDPADRPGRRGWASARGR